MFAHQQFIETCKISLLLSKHFLQLEWGKFDKVELCLISIAEFLILVENNCHDWNGLGERTGISVIAHFSNKMNFEVKSLMATFSTNIIITITIDVKETNRCDL